MTLPVRNVDLGGPDASEGGAREWLVTNGLGGYASGTIRGRLTRRFHGLLIAALAEGRMMMLNHLSELARVDGKVYALGEEPHPRLPSGTVEVAPLVAFSLEGGLPRWRYEADGFVIEKRLVMPHGQNTVHVLYDAPEGRPFELELEPFMHVRRHNGNVDDPVAEPYPLTALGDRFEVGPVDGNPPLRIRVSGESRRFIMEVSRIERVGYTVEHSRGYDWQGMLYSVGSFRARIGPGSGVALVASTERWDVVLAFSGEDAWSIEQARRRRLLTRAVPAARTGITAELALAADAFVIKPVGRHVEESRARASGDEVRTVIAGYHWFTDWGRDTMISLEGLTLVTGRHPEAGFILRTFAHFVRDGLIPNMFPEGEKDGLYHTADATLWFFHAIDRFLAYTGDEAMQRELLPVLFDIVEHHQRGTRFGIVVDEADGLLRQGAEGYQLTWMDAKVGDLVVTPRRGKAVEINALYYNALRLLEGWARDTGDARADRLREAADRLQRSFNARFWYEDGGYLYDVVDGETGDDASFRPNQILAVSLTHPVLDPARWKRVVHAVQERLWTPVGLRSLAPGSPAYKPQYFGNLYARDLAYHQGTVWAWLIGPFIDALLRVEDVGHEEELLRGFGPELGTACVGTISEIFDAEPPYTARGCVAQAWSVAESLRSLVKIAERRGATAR